MSLINWADLVERYPNTFKAGGGSTSVSCSFILPAISELHSRLSGCFTTPFTATNETARDLAIDLAYLRMATGKTETADKIRERVDATIEALKMGSRSMIYIDGTVAQTSPGTAFSNSGDYHSSFGFVEVQDQLVDPDKVEAAYNERIT